MANEAYLAAVSTKVDSDQVIMNRNTSPKRPLSDEDIVSAVLETPFNQYPEDQEADFIQAYSQYNGFDPKEIAVANGADEWLQKLIIQFGQKGVLALDPDFFMYEDYTNQLGYPFYKVETTDQFTFSLMSIIDGLDRYQPSLLFISNPQNPTGQQFSSEFLQSIADATESRNVIFVIDEAYVEFADPYRRPDNGNVIYVRTLSKIYALAGLRIGLALGHGPVFEKLRQINHPYPVNSISLALAGKLFEDTEQLDQWVAYQKRLQEALVAAFNQVADIVTVMPSKSNYVFMFGDRVPELVAHLQSAGFIGRVYDDEKMVNAARYSIIDEADYPRLKTVIKEWREQIED